jgi:hypothetical protein
MPFYEEVLKTGLLIRQTVRQVERTELQILQTERRPAPNYTTEKGFLFLSPEKY